MCKLITKLPLTLQFLNFYSFRGKPRERVKGLNITFFPINAWKQPHKMQEKKKKKKKKLNKTSSQTGPVVKVPRGPTLNRC